MTKMSEPYCYRCMHLKVTAPGELCKRCHEGWEPPRPPSPKAMKPLGEWSLEELIATQDSGTVPGQAMYERHETTFTDAGLW